MKQKTIYKNGRLCGQAVDLEITDGKFTAIGRINEPGIDLGGLDVFPGLIDIHCHGAMGYDVMDGVEEYEKMNVYFASRGITTWFPTTGGSAESMRRILAISLDGIRGANMPGFHLEGPYLSPDALGAISAESIKLPDPADFADFDNVKLITVAPELPGAIDYIRTTSARVSIGHTTADYATAMAAFEAGASCVTHTFNAMTPLHHREPGVLGAAIDGDAWVQVISDGVHLHPSVVKMLYRTFGKKMILISDAVSGTGLPDGVYMRQGKYPRRIVDGTIRTSTGRLAGSASDLYRDVCCAIRFGIPRDDAFYMASTAPAEYMGLNKGRIELGYDADFIAIDAENSIHTVVIGGEIFTP